MISNHTRAIKDLIAAVEYPKQRADLLMVSEVTLGRADFYANIQCIS